MLATNSSLLPTSVLKGASSHVHAAFPTGFDPCGPKPSCASSVSVAPELEVTPSIHTCPYALSVRFTALIVCDMVGGHWRFAQPIVRCGSADASFESTLALPAESRARTTK